jgi:hypothetical protein
VQSNGPHECGHIVVLFKKRRLIGLDFLPHEQALDGAKGVFETATVELSKEDCVALAAGLVGELVCVGQYDSQRILDDRNKVKEIVGQPLEDFVLEAYAVIQDNLLFFALLNIQVQQKMLALLNHVFSLSDEDYGKLPARIAVITLAEIERVYEQAQSTLDGFSPQSGAL